MNYMIPKLKFLILLLGVWTVPALADMPVIPPSANQAVVSSVPSGQPMDFRTAGTSRPSTSYFDGGHWSYNPNSSNKVTAHFDRVNTSNGNITGTKTNPATFTDQYGNKASGNITTQTNVGKPSALAQGFGALMVGQIGAAHINNLTNQGVADQMSRGFVNGNWDQVAMGIGKIFDWTGLGGAIANAVYGNPAYQQQVIAPMQQKAMEQAQQDFNAYQQQKKSILLIMPNTRS